jgi:hypothetical protein
MTEFRITMQESKVSGFVKILDFLELEYTKSHPIQCSMTFLLTGEIKFYVNFVIKHTLRSQRELKSVLRMAGAYIGPERKKYICLSRQAMDMFSTKKKESKKAVEYEYFMPFVDFDRYQDDGRCVRCEGWGCETCSHTGGY